MESAPEIRYAKADDGVDLAYQVFGDGDVALVGVPPIISNIEVIWEHPETASFLRTLGSFSRFVHYDKRGQGMSDRHADVPTLEQRALDTRAVMDAAGIERAVIAGASEGGSTAAMLAATCPERVAGLILFGTFARLLVDDDYPIGWAPEVGDQVADAWAASWGRPDSLTAALIRPEYLADERFCAWLRRYERQSSTPSGLRDQLRWAGQIDIRSILPTLSVPTMVMHFAGDPFVSVEFGRWLGDHIPRSRYVEYPGREHVPYFGTYHDVTADIEEFVTGRRTQPRVERVLATVLFSDIVSSTEHAARMGDRDWHEALDCHDVMAQRIIESHGGRVVKSTGDGLLATFDGPARGVHCATELTSAARGLNLAIRAGLHTGEIELRSNDITGIAVHIAARVSAHASTGEVLVSRTVKDLVAGSGIAFDDRGLYELKGVPDRWQLLQVESS
jgi:class 3 adenylate cyclase/pimeloyl-ACP methyl ester carboxylesterase